MCDIYSAKCSHAKCSRVLEVHLADFALPREAVEVFCGKHLPARHVVIHRALEEEFLLRAGSTWGFRFNVAMPGGYDYGAFCPNWGIRTKMTIRGNPCKEAKRQ